MNLEDRLLALSLDKNPKSISKITAICSDSRKVSPGSTFIALKGRKTDGHQYLQSAIDQGASAIVIENIKALKTVNRRKTLCAITPSTRILLPQLLNDFYNFPSEKMFCVGITGTNGKTTISTLLSFLLSRLGWKTGLIGTIKNQFENQESKSPLTTPEPVELYNLLNQFYQKGAKALIMEVSSIGLDQHRVDGVDFNLGVFTNLSEDHLDYHSCMSEYFKAKKRFFEMSAQGKNFISIINLDDPYGIKIAKEIKAPYLSYGQKSARFSWKILSQDLFGSHFKLFYDNKSIKAYMPMPGIYNVSNAVASLCCVYACGFSIEAAISYLKSFPGVPGRMQKIHCANKATVFVDYAHTPQALFVTLSCLKQQKRGRLISVFGCGGERDSLKRPLMAKIANQLSDEVFLTTDNCRNEKPLKIIKDCLKGVRDKSKFTIQLDRKKAIFEVLEKAKEQDIVLIAGKGHEEIQITGSEKHYFSDTQTVKDFFLTSEKPIS